MRQLQITSFLEGKNVLNYPQLLGVHLNMASILEAVI